MTCFGPPTYVRGGAPVAVDEPSQSTELSLLPASPNPFRTSTTLRFSTSRAGLVSLKVFDVKGRLVRTLEEGLKGAGQHYSSWDGTDDRGESQATGYYFAQLNVNNEGEQTVKMLFVK